MNNAQSDPLPPGLRKYLYSTAAITGAAILVVEILGAKMLSPYVGSSHFVWTAQIAVTLVSLALGYWFGGWLVDRAPRLERLYTCIAAAAIYLAFTVAATEKVAYAFLDPEMKISLGAVTLICSTMLFLVPLTLLAATGPFLIRILTQSVESVGSQVGRLSAISTFGSVAGTALIGYFLIPRMSNSKTMFITAGVLLALAVIYFAIWNRAAKRLPTMALIGVVAMAVSSWLNEKTNSQLHRMNRLYIGNSDFGQLQVLEQKGGTRRFYLNDYLIQNTYDTKEKASLSLFTYMLHELAWGYSPKMSNALCIGLGIGIVPAAMAREGVRVDVVEINPAIVPVAQQYFDFDPAAVNVTIGDGRYFINKSQNKYDAILLDAFLGDSSPSHLMSREAFAEMARLLGPDGVLVINSFGEFRPGRDFFVGSLDKTLHATFKNVQIHASGNGNVFWVASQRELNLKIRENREFPQHTDLSEEFNRALTPAPRPDPSAGIVLTDDFNPVEFYDAPNREKHRRMLALSIKEL